MERVTRAARVRRALEPLDSLLAVRVFDQRGMEMSGVPVRWTLVGRSEGATLRVLSARTDAFGVSRAAFTPGLSADPQGPIAEVRGVGRIDFALTVPVKSIRVVPETVMLWAGEDADVRAQLTDDAGHELTGGKLRWVTTDSTVARVISSDSARARVTGRLAGMATLVGWIGDGTTRGSARLNVRPIVIGRFVTIDGGSVPAMTMEIRAGGFRDSVGVEAGRFAQKMEMPPDADVDVRAAPQSDSSMYHPVHVRIRLQRELQDLRIALVPRSWRIDAGAFEGQTIAIDATRAMRRSVSGSPFWRLVPISGRDPRKLLGWRESDFPLRIAFNRTRSNERITDEDSAAFWSIASQMQRDLGAEVIVPAEMGGDSSRSNLVRVQVMSQATEGHTFVSWGQAGDAGDGVMVFRHATTLHDPQVVTHELVHLLGFGHSTSWTTVSQPMGGRQSRLTPEDVAYMQLAMRLRRLQQQTGARPGLPIASQ